MPSKNTTQEPNISQVIFASLAIALFMLVFIIYYYNLDADRSLTPIKLAVGEWAPYTGEELEENGIASAIITKVFQDIGYQAEYHFMPWPIAEEMAAEGANDSEIQGTFPYTENESRRSGYYFSETILNIEFALFYHAQNNPAAAEIRTTGDLENHIVLGIEGYEYPKEIQQFVSKNQYIMRDNMEAFLQLSKSKEPLLAVEAIEVGEQLLEQKLPQLASQIRMVPLKFSTDCKLMLSKRNPDNLALLRAFNNQLGVLQSNNNEYTSLQTSIKNRIDMAHAVRLEPYELQGLIPAYKSPDKKFRILLPKGSKAVVKKWDNAFLNYQVNRANPENTLVKIKLLNGPFTLKDSLLYVDGRAIHLRDK